MIRRPPRSTLSSSSAASDVYKRQLGASRYLHDQAKKTGNAKQFIESSSLGNDSRQNLLAAHELCAREAKARIAAHPELGVPAWIKQAREADYSQPAEGANDETQE